MTNIETMGTNPLAEVHLQCFDTEEGLIFRYRVHGEQDDIGAMIISISEKNPFLGRAISAAGTLIAVRRERRARKWMLAALVALSALNLFMTIFHR